MTSETAQLAFEAEVRELENRLGGILGFSARALASGETIGVNADECFPMASTYKIPIAATLLVRVDEGELKLADMIMVAPETAAQTGPIAQSVIHPGVSLSIANLVELMITRSNNNATDRCLDLAGGPASVTAWLHAAGIETMRVDNSVNDLLNKFYGFEPGSDSENAFLARWATQEEQDLATHLSPPGFDDSPEDSCTPAAMIDLLDALFARDALAPASRDFLFGVMSRCETGLGRIRGMLPPHVVTARKTGTVGGTINDCGIIVMPDTGKQVALAVYTKGSRVFPYTARETLVAEIARSVFDYFRFR